MAIFHLAHCFVRRSNGSSSVATAAYIAGQKLSDNQRSSEFSDYSRKGGVLFDEITLPVGTPLWANSRGDFWRRLELREDRSTRPEQAILAHNFNLALPHELTLEQNIFLACDFVREQFTRKGYAVDWAIHSPDPRGDSRNIHLHILVPLRQIEGEGFGNKDRYTKQQLRQKITGLRQSWARLTNRHLKRYGHNTAIDERTLKQQGIARLPTRHQGIRSKSNRHILDGLRAKQPALPIAPIVRISKQQGPDGTIQLQMAISHSGLSNIGKQLPTAGPQGGNNKDDNNRGHNLSVNPDHNGWPPEAIVAWQAWGSKNPPLFFRIWAELTHVGFNFSEGGLNL